ncbi:MAG: hypothetical protein AAFN77_24230 [Planctomycetota bacterium]
MFESESTRESSVRNKVAARHIFHQRFELLALMESADLFGQTRKYLIHEECRKVLVLIEIDEKRLAECSEKQTIEKPDSFMATTIKPLCQFRKSFF